jgi:hypothetical protein
MVIDKTIEARIREVLANETSAIPLSDQLFSPTGLFNLLAHDEQERRAVASSPLFRQAQDRLHELQQCEAKAISRTISQLDLPAGAFRVKIEPSEAR